MNRIVALLSVLILGCPGMTLAGPKEEVAAATQAWIDGMNSRDPERVVALYDPEAVLWGTISPVLRDNPAAIRDYFNALRGYRPEFNVLLGEQRVRLFGDFAINTGSYSFSNVRDGKPTNLPARFSFVYRNRDGRWLIVDHHSSAVPAHLSSPLQLEAAPMIAEPPAAAGDHHRGRHVARVATWFGPRRQGSAF